MRQSNTRERVLCTLQLMNVAGQSAIEECIGIVKTRLDNRHGDSGGHRVSECRSDVYEHPGMKMDVSAEKLSMLF